MTGLVACYLVVVVVVSSDGDGDVDVQQYNCGDAAVGDVCFKNNKPSHRPSCLAMAVWIGCEVATFIAFDALLTLFQHGASRLCLHGSRCKEQQPQEAAATSHLHTLRHLRA